VERSYPVGRVLPGLLLAMLLGALDQTALAPALPAVARELGGLDQLPGVVTWYLAAATVAMPVHGRLGDRFGRKRVLLAAVALFSAGAVLCAFTTSMPQLIACRIVQGLGAGGLMVAPQAVIGEIVSPRERGRYLGLIGGAYVVAAVGGPVVGGLVAETLGWRWIFGFYPVLGVVAFVVIARSLRLPQPPSGARPPLDVAGALGLGVAVTGIVLFGQTREAVWAVVAGAGVVAWAVVTRFAADPILPLRLFRTRAFAIPAAVSFLIGFALFGTLTYLPSYLQIVLGARADLAGLVVTALMAGVLVTTVVSGRLITKTGRYKGFPVAGTAIAATGMAALAVLGAGAGPLVLGGVMAVIGLGVGLVMQVMVLVAQNSVAHADLGTATATATFLRQIGASAGVAVAGMLITSRISDRVSDAEAFRIAVPQVFGLMVPVLAVAFVLALLLPAHPLRTTAHVGEAS
jgi:MFS family permease